MFRPLAGSTTLASPSSEANASRRPSADTSTPLNRAACPEEVASLGCQQRSPKRIFCGRRGRGPRRLRCEQQAELGVLLELPDGGRVELARIRLPGAVVRVRALDERERGCHDDECEHGGAECEEPPEPRALTVPLGQLVLDLALGSVAGAPREHRLREHVVEDLVPLLAAFLHGAEDSAVGECRQHRPELLGRDVAEVLEVRDLVRDLRPGGGDEVVEEPRRDILLLRRQLGHCALEVLLDDLRGSAEPLERLDAQRTRSGGSLLVPEPLHDELQVRSFDARAVVAAFDRAEAAERRLDLARADLVQDPPDECGLHRDGRTGELGEALERAFDRRSRGPSVEAIEPERIGEQAGDSPREAVELGEGVLAERDEDVDAKRRSQHRGQRLGEGAGPSVVGVVEEVLLGLVEDEVDVAPRLRLLERGCGSRAVGAVAGGLSERFCQRRRRVLAPAREDDHQRLLRQFPQRARDRGSQERRLPDAARPVQHRQARRDQVRDHDLALALAAEEEQRVELGVLEGIQALVRRLGCLHHAAASSLRSSNST